jgi:hypothetical protein
VNRLSTTSRLMSTWRFRGRTPRGTGGVPRRSDRAALRPRLGSREGNSHVHWHLAPLPRGVPFAQQQLAALDTDLGLDLGDDALDELVARIRAALAETGDRRA